MNNRLWILGTAIVCIAVIALGWFLGVTPKLAEGADADIQTTDVDSQNAIFSAELDAIKLENENLPALKSQLAELRVGLPAETQQSEFLAEVNAAAARAGVDVDTASFSEPQPYTSVDPLPMDAPLSGTSEATATDEPVDPAETPTDPNAVATADSGNVPHQTETSALVTPLNFVSLTVQFAVKGSSSDSIDFLKAMQSTDRIFLITNADMTEDASGASESDSGSSSQYTTSVTGLIYILLDEPMVLPGAPAEEVEPAPTETPVP